MAGALLYSIAVTLLIITTALFLTRDRWLNYVPRSFYSRLTSFANDIEEGLTSEDFDLSTNITSGDQRAGLDERGRHEIKRIMKSQAVSFDEARRIYTQSRFAMNNIGPDGRPRDPKFVSFS